MTAGWLTFLTEPKYSAPVTHKPFAGCMSPHHIPLTIINVKLRVNEVRSEFDVMADGYV
jgi:hypothetical protein